MKKIPQQAFKVIEKEIQEQSNKLRKKKGKLFMGNIRNKSVMRSEKNQNMHESGVIYHQQSQGAINTSLPTALRNSSHSGISSRFNRNFKKALRTTGNSPVMDKDTLDSIEHRKENGFPLISQSPSSAGVKQQNSPKNMNNSLYARGLRTPIK